MFKAVKDCITSEDISWTDCVGICIDGAAALTGLKKCFQAEVRQVAPVANFIHCIIQREALASRDLQLQFQTMLQEAVNVVNFVFDRP
jgi:hypothetical protein